MVSQSKPFCFSNYSTETQLQHRRMVNQGAGTAVQEIKHDIWRYVGLERWFTKVLAR